MHFHKSLVVFDLLSLSRPIYLWGLMMLFQLFWRFWAVISVPYHLPMRFDDGFSTLLAFLDCCVCPPHLPLMCGGTVDTTFQKLKFLCCFLNRSVCQWWLEVFLHFMCCFWTEITADVHTQDLMLFFCCLKSRFDCMSVCSAHLPMMRGDCPIPSTNDGDFTTPLLFW